MIQLIIRVIKYHSLRISIQNVNKHFAFYPLEVMRGRSLGEYEEQSFRTGFISPIKIMITSYKNDLFSDVGVGCLQICVCPLGDV